jgi:hypothetical protein
MKDKERKKANLKKATYIESKKGASLAWNQLVMMVLAVIALIILVIIAISAGRGGSEFFEIFRAMMY